MLCPYPVTTPSGLRPCGQCMACRVNRKRTWVGRMLSERAAHTNESLFITLTYNDEHLPQGGNLKPLHVRHFLQRLRRLGSLGPAPQALRYFFVGEYGEQKMRPHYHAILFGMGNPSTWRPVIQAAWTYNGESIGHTMTAPAESGALSYCAHYVTKKMTSEADERLEGRHPEFTRMSQKPVLGYQSLIMRARALNTKEGARLVAEKGIPTSYRINGAVYRYTKADYLKLVDLAGFTDPELAERCWQGDGWTLDDAVARVYIQAEHGRWTAARLHNEVQRLEEEFSKIDKTARYAAAEALAEKLFRRRQVEAMERRSL